MKKHTRNVISLLLVLGALVANFGAAQAVEPRYTGIRSIVSDLSISTVGEASCRGKVTLESGYTADLQVELKRDGTTIKTWTSSGSGNISAGGTYYVTSGHTYIVTTTATVYDKNGSQIETPSVDSAKKFY